MNAITETNVEERIRTALLSIMDVQVEPESIPTNTPLLGSGLGLDSVIMFRLIIEIEKEFGVEFDDKVIGPELLKDIDSIGRYVRELQQAATSE